MNISKYVEFLLVEKVGKNNKPYYAIVMRVGEKEFVLTFMSKDKYDLLVSTLPN